MKIKVSEIPDEGLEIDTRAGLLLDGSETPAELKFRIYRKGPEVFVSGEVRAKVELACGRCLNRFDRELSVPVDITYRPVEELKEESRELETGELETGFYRDDELDLETVASEQVLLNIPMKPLCDDACRGICPKCGANLNEGACACGTGQPDGTGQPGGETSLGKFFKERSS